MLTLWSVLVSHTTLQLLLGRPVATSQWIGLALNTVVCGLPPLLSRVAALYERGRVVHFEPMTELEEQLCSYVPGQSTKSPDRLDALVWALTDLMLDAKTAPRPRVGIV